MWREDALKENRLALFEELQRRTVWGQVPVHVEIDDHAVATNPELTSQSRKGSGPMPKAELVNVILITNKCDHVHLQFVRSANLT